MKRTALLLVLLVAYGGLFGRRLITGSGEAFDPVAPQAREIERALADEQYNRALPLAKELETLYPNEPLVELWLAESYSGLRRFADAATAWERFIEVGSAPEEACPWIAYAYTGEIDQGRLNLAAFERCARLDPRDSENLAGLGDALGGAGKPEEALAAYRRAAALDPKNPFFANQVARYSRELAEGRR